MTDTDAVTELPEPSPEYLALPKSERDALDDIVKAMQDLQNDVDGAIAVMGGPVFYLGKLLLAHELQVRTLRRQVTDLQRRLTDLEDRVS